MRAYGGCLAYERGIHLAGHRHADEHQPHAEYVVTTNVTSTTKCLTGWTVRDAAGHVYKFGTFCLGGYKTVTLHTGRGTNTAAHRYWGSGNYIWNNTGDRAYLRNAAGTQMDYCAWGSGAGYINC